MLLYNTAKLSKVYLEDQYFIIYKLWIERKFYQKVKVKFIKSGIHLSFSN